VTMSSFRGRRRACCHGEAREQFQRAIALSADPAIGAVLAGSIAQMPRQGL
jgi:hypothetical protein